MENASMKKLIRLMKKQDEEAFNEIYRRYHRLVFYVGYQLTKNDADAEEIVQETFLQVQRSIMDLKDPEQFKAWIGKIAHSKAITLLRKNKNQQMSDAQLEHLSNKAETKVEFCPDALNRHDTDMKVLHQCIANLKLPYREVLVLYYFVQLNIKEISLALNSPEGTVKSRLLYGKKYLKEEIEQYEKANDIKVSFHASALEAVLLAAGGSMVLTPSSSLFTLPRVVIPNTAILLAMKVLGIIAISSAVLYGSFQLLGHGKANDTMTKTDDLSIPFPVMYYENMAVYTPREAYELLLKEAHCEVELVEKNEEQLKEITKIYEALHEYGGVYDQLLLTHEWDQMLYQFIEK